MAARKSKTITNKEDIDYILSLDEDSITQRTIWAMFGEFNGKVRFNQYDIIEIPPNSYGPEGKRNNNSFTTTIGIWIFNRFFIERDLFDVFHYINETINSDKFEELCSVISNRVMEDDISTATLNRFLVKTQYFMPTTTALTYGSTEKIYGLSDYITPKKKALIKKHQKELDEGNAIVAESIEKELIADAREYLKDDPSLDIYESGARSSVGNHIKNMYIMKGAVRNPDPNDKRKYYIIESSLNDGVSKDEYAALSKSLSRGPYMRSQKTSLGGYWEKLFVSAFQDVVIGPPNSDCGTKNTLEVHLTEKNVSDWLYSYIVKGSQLIELTSKNKDQYIGKTVNFRFASLCESKNCICNKCASNRFNRLNVTNVGVAMGMIASKIKNINMKAFHDGTVSSVEIDPKKAFGE